MARKRSKELRVAYLFPDGHAKLVYKLEEPMAPHGYIEVVEVIEKFCKSRFRGRVVIHDTGLLASLKDASMVVAKEPRLEGGSEKSKEMGLRIGYLSVNNKFGHFAICNVCDSIGGPVLSGGFTFQPEEKWEEEFSNAKVGDLWAENKIVKVILSKNKE